MTLTPQAQAVGADEIRFDRMAMPIRPIAAEMADRAPAMANKSRRLNLIG